MYSLGLNRNSSGLKSMIVFSRFSRIESAKHSVGLYVVEESYRRVKQRSR